MFTNVATGEFVTIANRENGNERSAAEVILDQRDPPRTIHDPREVPIPRSELRVVLTVAVAEEPARWASVGVLCGFLIRLPLLRPLELRRAA